MNAVKDIPVGKVLVPVEIENYDCDECFFNDYCEGGGVAPPCTSDQRIDGKDVIYKIFDASAQISLDAEKNN